MKDDLVSQSSFFKRKPLVLKVAVLLACVTLIAGTALGFGGHGGGRKSSAYKNGVHAIGVHYNTAPDQTETPCPAHSERR